jgi:hypothetical protein
MMMVTIITISMADTSSTSSLTTEVPVNKRDYKKSPAESKDKGFKP